MAMGLTLNLVYTLEFLRFLHLASDVNESIPYHTIPASIFDQLVESLADVFVDVWATEHNRTLSKLL